MTHTLEKIDAAARLRWARGNPAPQRMIAWIDDSAALRRMDRSADAAPLRRSLPFVTLTATATEALHFAMCSDVRALAEDVHFHHGVCDIPAVRLPESRRTLPCTGRGVRIALLDTGVSPHPDLPPLDVVDVTGENDGHDCHGHGTFLAGQLVARGLYAGLARDVELLVVRVFDRCIETSRARILAGLDAALSFGAQLVALSLGGPLADLVTRAAIRRVHDSGAVVVASVGNDGPRDGTVSAPALLPEVLAVGAVDRSGALAPFTGRDSAARKPDVVAEGVDVAGLKVPQGRMGWAIDADYVVASGTSVAVAPVVAVLAWLVERGLLPHEARQVVTADWDTGP